MRIVPPVPAEEITSSAFAFNIRISDVDDALCGRLETAISHYFSRNCAEGVIARNESDPTILDVACKIRYEKRIKQFSLVRSLRTRHISPCFPEGYLGQGCGSSDRFRNQPQLPFILFTTPKTARDFPTQNDSEFIIVSLTGRPHYKSRVVFRTVFPKTTGTMRASLISSFW